MGKSQGSTHQKGGSKPAPKLSQISAPTVPPRSGPLPTPEDFISNLQRNLKKDTQEFGQPKNVTAAEKREAKL